MIPKRRLIQNLILGLTCISSSLVAMASPCTGSELLTTEDAFIEDALASARGLAGVAHGLGEGRRAAVMSVTAAGDFFNGRQLNLIPMSVAVQNGLAALGRNDKICVRGELTSYSDEQAHINVREVRLLEAWQMPYGHLPPYEYRSPSADELPDSGILDAQVHAIGRGMLILEAGDRIIPLVVRNPAFVPDGLYRFDRIQVAYGSKVKHGGVTHLLLDEGASPAINVTESLKTAHGELTSVTGHLVLFPRSPLISRDIYGIGTRDNGQDINYTIVNFEDFEIFEQVQQKLADFWLKNEDRVVRGRNYFLIPDLTITASGILNIQSPSQANPQILVEDVADVLEAAAAGPEL